MEQTEKQRAIQSIITSLAEKTEGITSEQIDLVREIYAEDERSLEEIEQELQGYCASITSNNAAMSMRKIHNPEKYSLDIDVSTKGMYLGETQIDLMTITEINSTNELLEFIANCQQVDYSEVQLKELYKMKIDSAKRKVFDDYRNSLIGTLELQRDPSIVLRKKIEFLGLPADITDEVLALYKDGKTDQAINYITTRLNLDYGTITSQTFKRHFIDHDDVKCSSYEEISALAKKVSDFDSITIISGKYNSVINNGKFDSYHIKRCLDFCKKHDIQARYHSLLTQDILEQFQGKSKDEIIEQLRKFVSSSIEFISAYNEENKLSDGMPIINTIDIFNELINLKKDKTVRNGYYNIWEQLGITIPDLIDIFAPAVGNKPEGVEYIYNEAFVETDEKRQIQLNLAREIKKQAPELIDIFGTQMHVTTEFKDSTIERTFFELKSFSAETGIKLAITEFDMYVPERVVDKLKRAGKTDDEIKEYVQYIKLTKLNRIAAIAKETGIEFTEIAYWSMTDSMDHNKKRQERETLYGGLFGYSLEPKAVKEIVEYAPIVERPNNTTDVLGYTNMLNSLLEVQPAITPQSKNEEITEPAKQLVKKEKEVAKTSDTQDDAGFANFPQILILTLWIIAVLYILLM